MRAARCLLIAMATLTAAPLLQAQRNTSARAPFVVPLYGGDIPGAPRSQQPERFERPKGDPIARVTHVQAPDLRVFLPIHSRATGTAVVIFPGGGYSILAIDHEGWAIARWLNAKGVAAIVVKYRVSSIERDVYRYPVPLLDARQALRVVRSNARAWGIDTARVGVMGFSAGGHLASMMLTMMTDTVTGDVAVPSSRHRPDFGVLVYPVISMHERWGHRGSSDNLLGPTATDSVRAQLSTDRRVTGTTPPTFLVATQDDDAVPAQNAMAFYQAMTAHTVPGELHIWETGGHGFGMLPGGAPVAHEWLPRLVAWMTARGLLRRRD